jgi:hypothetical protein
MPEHDNPESQVRAKFVAQDHRRAVRFRSNCEALVSPLNSDEAPITVQIRDVSTTGIGFLTTRPWQSSRRAAGKTLGPRS